MKKPKIKIKFNKKIFKRVMLILLCIVLVAGIVTSSVLFFGGKIDRTRGFDISNNGYSFENSEVKRLISVVPSSRQLAFDELEYYNFIHYGMNTFTDDEWGDGTADPHEFNPENVDTDQWCQVLKDSGSKGIIFTAKHHDGFCLWQTEYTDYSIKNSPYMNGEGDIVKQLADSCKKYDLKFGIYLSPWDRNNPDYGTDAYNEYFVNQLTELCTNYGELFCVWFDGAKGDDVEDFEYDFDRYFDLVHRLQPNAVTSICGTDVRWIGNEAGSVRESEWSVVPFGTVSVDGTTDLPEITSTSPDLGSRDLIKDYQNLRWYPAEADTSIFKSDWFYHDNSKLKSAKELADIYFDSVGGNASLLLNVPPSKNGIIEENEVKTLQKFKSIIGETFENKVDYTVSGDTSNDTILSGIKDGSESAQLVTGDAMLTFKFDQKEKIKTIVLEEDISKSQRIEGFEIYAKVPGGYKKVYKGTTIGSKKIVRLNFPYVRNSDEFVIMFTQTRSYPFIKSIQFYS